MGSNDLCITRLGEQTPSGLRGIWKPVTLQDVPFQADPPSGSLVRVGRAYTEEQVSADTELPSRET